MFFLNLNTLDKECCLLHLLKISKPLSSNYEKNYISKPDQLHAPPTAYKCCNFEFCVEYMLEDSVCIQRETNNQTQCR